MKSLLYSLFFLIAILFIPVTSPAWECDVTLDAPKTIKIDQEVILTADGTPTGGSYSWSRTKNLTPDGATATLIGHKPNYSEYIQVIAYYRSPKGKKCKDVKWIWACACNVTRINGPATAKVGQKVALTAEAEPTGGAYTWTIVSGSGSLTPDDSSAEFIGDKAGSVEIKVSYVPPDGGEPCTKYHTIEVEGECEVTLTADMYQRPICMVVNLSTEVYPTGGTCSWAGAGINGSGCSATFNKQTGGNSTITVTYTTPGGSTCDANASISTYSLDLMDSNKNCFESGTALQLSDFDFFTTPAGFSVRPVLSPTTVTTNQSQSRVLVTASPFCDAGSSNEVSTVINVVNKEIKTTAGIQIEIPNYLTEPLKKLGLVRDFKLKIQNSYSKITECCTDMPTNSTGGKTNIRASIEMEGNLIGPHLPNKFNKYVIFTPLGYSFDANGDVEIKGEKYGCLSIPTWSGGGTLSARAEFKAEALSKVPGQYFVLKGKLSCRGNISQIMSIRSKKLSVTGKWGVVDLVGAIKVKAIGLTVVDTFYTHTLIKGGTPPPYSIDLPSLQ